jgi:hypothetical protein
MSKATRRAGRVAFAAALALFLAAMAAAPAAADQVIADDLIVNGGSACIGFDCVDGENFGFDTLKLKENNTRMLFDDTSSSSGFPANDWELVANDSASGGLNKFSIRDVTANRTPFTVEAGAPTDSLYVDSSHRIGFGTHDPILELHVVDGDTPGLRLEQNATNGFTPQTWDVAGNEANFFVRDVTGGSRLPFRIRPKAPTSSIDVAASGNVGVDNASPTATLHVKRSDGTAQVKVEETNSTSAPRTLLTLKNNGPARTQWIDVENPGSQTWDVGMFAENFVLNSGGTPRDLLLHPNGDLQIGGSLTQLSDRNAKTNFKRVDPRAVLAKVAGLPLSTWSYKDDPIGVTHLGPMAQDFSAAFGLGADRRYIAPADMGGVSLAAIKALVEQNRLLEAQVQALKARVTKLGG